MPRPRASQVDFACYGRNRFSEPGFGLRAKKRHLRADRQSQEEFSITRPLTCGFALRLNALDMIQEKLKALTQQ
jgi:hypothetical protein